jgi:hypothetical protein
MGGQLIQRTVQIADHRELGVGEIRQHDPLIDPETRDLPGLPADPPVGFLQFPQLIDPAVRDPRGQRRQIDLAAESARSTRRKVGFTSISPVRDNSNSSCAAPTGRSAALQQDRRSRTRVSISGLLRARASALPGSWRSLRRKAPFSAGWRGTG